MAEAAAEAGDAMRTVKDLVSGAAGGVAQVLIGQPFDIVKVRLQTTSQYPSALSAATTIYAREGALAFYKGTLTPLLGIGACVSIQFAAFGYAKRAFEASNNHHHQQSGSSSSSSSSSSSNSPLSYTQYYLSGAFAGLANTVLSTPIEHVRIRLQTQPHGAARLYAGPLDCARQLGLRGVYRGTSVTLVREAQAYGMWFLSFEWLMARHLRGMGSGAQRRDVPAHMVALYGGLAGEALWLGSYPFDVVKSKMQTDGFDTGEGKGEGKGRGTQRYRNMRDCFAQTWRQEGMRGFWRGLGPTLVRALPVSAGTFAVVEMTMRALG